MKMIKTTNVKFEKGVKEDGTKFQRTYYEEKPFDELAEKAIKDFKALIVFLKNEETKMCPLGYGIAYQKDAVKVARYRALNTSRREIERILSTHSLLHEE